MNGVPAAVDVSVDQDIVIGIELGNEVRSPHDQFHYNAFLECLESPRNCILHLLPSGNTMLQQEASRHIVALAVFEAYCYVHARCLEDM